MAVIGRVRFLWKRLGTAFPHLFWPCERCSHTYLNLDKVQDALRDLVDSEDRREKSNSSGSAGRDLHRSCLAADDNNYSWAPPPPIFDVCRSAATSDNLWVHRCFSHHVGLL